MTERDASPAVRRERWAAAVLTAFGAVATVGAWSLPFGGVTRPGPGFLPLCLAAGLTVVGAALLIAPPATAVAADAAPPSRRGLARAGLTLAVLFAYTAALAWLGFGVATFLLIAVLFRAIEPQPWPVALGGAAGTVVACHVLFRVWLGVRLPVGPWGF